MVSSCERGSMCTKGSGQTVFCSVSNTPESLHIELKNGEQWVKAINVSTLFLAVQRFQNSGLKFKLVAGNTGSGTANVKF